MKTLEQERKIRKGRKKQKKEETVEGGIEKNRTRD